MIRLDQICIQMGNFRLDHVSLEIPTGLYGVLMGKTGSGKTTILEAVAGLKHVAEGTIHLGSQDVTRLKPAERHVGYVPQDGALFATMSVREQLGFALTVRRVDRREIARRVAEMAEMLHIGALLDRSVQGLSGGERQRVALGRALAFHPTTLLLDEPLSALDDDTRAQMCELLLEIRDQTGVTTLHVTHSLEEAQRLCDRLFRVEEGRVVERLSSERSVEVSP